VGTVEVRDRRTVDDRVDLSRQFHVGLLGQPQPHFGNVTQRSSHIRPGDWRMMHQALDIEIPESLQQRTPDDT
jgi:hypothetical protein